MEMDIGFMVSTVALMLLGNITHVVKKVVEVREMDGTFSLKRYVSMYPYKTFLVFMYGLGGYLGLLSAGELTYVSSFLMGFTANSMGGIDAKKAKE